MAKKRTKKQLRASALKGWATRRAAALPAKVRAAEMLANNARIVAGKKPKKRKDGRFKSEKIIEQEKKIADLEARLAMAESDRKALEETAHFTHTKAPEYLHEDWTLAVMPSRLRHRAETAEIRKAMKRAERNGKESFDEMARQVAEFYEVEVQEVYTVHFSP